MPTVSKKVTNFPRLPEAANGMDAASSHHVSGPDPLKEINSLISQLQETAREAEARRQIAEDERDRFAAELAAERDLHRQQNFKSRQAVDDLQAKLEEFERRDDELARLRDENKRAGVAAQRKVDEATRAKNAAVAERDSLRKELRTAKKEIEEANRNGTAASRQVTELRKSAADATAALADATSALADTRSALAEARSALVEAKKQLGALRQARDTATGNVTALKATISRLEDQVAELTERCESAEQTNPGNASDAAAVKAAEADEIEMLRKEIELLNLEHESRIARIIARHDAEAEQFRQSVNGARSDTAVPETREDSDEIARLKAEVAKLKPKAEDFDVLTGRFERQRLETIELSTMLENAQRDIRELGASLAEARLLLKAGAAKSGADAKSAASRTRGSSGGRKILGKMRRAAQGLIENPSDIGILSELFDHSMALAGESEKHGGDVLRRAADAFASLLCDAQAMPEQVTPALVRTLNQTLDFLGEALEKPPGELRGALDDARIFVVDDDVAGSAIITSAFESVGISATATALPGEAIAELACNSYDLIILDVGLPEIDGFELCAQIRCMEMNADTPVLFVAGDASLEKRGEASRSGGDDFVSKPFNVAELALRGLLHVLRTRLQIA